MKTLLIYGDSVSCEFQHDPEITWTRRLQRLLDENGYAIEIINESVGGETTSRGRHRLPRVLSKAHYDYVFLELGGNDFLSGQVPFEEIYINLTEMVKGFESAGATVLLQEVLIGLNRRSPEDIAFNDIYHRVAKELNLFLVPLPKIETEDELWTARSLFAEDRIHFTHEAQPLIAGWVFQHIKDQLQPA